MHRCGAAARRASVKPRVHILRHTFCSHLAMRGAPARAIQELAGHKDLSDDAAVHAPQSGGDSMHAIRLLDEPARSAEVVETCVETGDESNS